MIFAIIGTRKPDENQAEAAKNLAFAIAIIGNHTIRTGAAYGIDQKAMEGTQGRNLEVYLPWSSYNRELVPIRSKLIIYSRSEHVEWTESVRKYHPAAHKLSNGAFALHARNFGIVSGCDWVIAFPDETGGGGTGQGIRIAEGLKIPVIQVNKGSIQDTPRWLGKTLQQLNLASKDLAVTILNGR